MTIYQIVTLIFAASLPVGVVAVIVRHVVSVVRSLRDGRFGFALQSLLAIAGMSLLFAGVAVVWFGYGVSHSRKDLWSDLMVLAVSAVAVHGGGYGLWRLARFIDRRAGGDDA